MKHILVPTDFSRNAEEALFYATRLFQKQTCTFYILHTFEVDSPLFTSRLNTEKGKELYDQLSADSECKLKEVLHSIVRDTEDYDHKFEIISVSKPLIDTIEKTILSKNIDLLVMGTKGATGAKEIFMGSNTIKVMDAIDSCPMLIIPKNIDVYPIYNIAFATDFKHKYREESIKTLTSFCDLYDATLKVIYVSYQAELTDKQIENNTELNAFLDNTRHGTICVDKYYSVEKHLLKMMKLLEFDMLAMIKYRHGFIAKMTHEAIIKKMGLHTKIPFLVIPDKLIKVIFR